MSGDSLEDAPEDAARLFVQPRVVLVYRAVEGQGPAFFINHHQLGSNAYPLSPLIRISRATIAANELVDVALAANNGQGDRQTRPEAKEPFTEREEEVVRAAKRDGAAVAVVAALEALTAAQAAAAEALNAVRTGVVRLLELE